MSPEDQIIELRNQFNVHKHRKYDFSPPLDIYRYIIFKVLGNTTDQTVATTFGGDLECPINGTIQEIGAWVDTAGTTGSATIDVNKNGTTLMGTTKITIETTEKSSRTAATQPVLTVFNILKGDIITVDIDAIQTTPAKGLSIYLKILEI